MDGVLVVTAEGLTHVGQVRSTNQDSFLLKPERQLYVVADGMGGHAGGEIASSLCVQEISTYLEKKSDVFLANKADLKHPDPRIAHVQADAINHASTKIYERALENPNLKGMGTTATLCQIVDKQAYLAHVGDSRCYLLRCGFIYQLTNDHSLVGEQVRAGLITKEEAELHHLRNVITRSVGYQEEEDVDTTSIALEPGDLLVMCSDGLHGKVTDKEISTLVTGHKLKATSKLIDLANERGGDDNITVVIVEISEATPNK